MTFNSWKKIGGATLGLLLFLGITFVSSTTAQAQYWPNQTTRQQREWERQQRERQRQLERQRQQQAQQGGWYDQYGNYHPYNQGYYNQGYYNRGRTADNYGNYGGSYQSRQTALNAGYNEGVKAGRDDRRSGRYNPYGHSSYNNANKDYNSRYGDRASYAQYFREAFINGYADGYRGY